MTDIDYPALWQSSNAASEANQRLFLSFARTHLILLGATGVISCWSPTAPEWEKAVSWSVAILMFLALILALLIKLLKFDDAWFETRAFAENTKGAAWKYMMQASAPTGTMADPAREYFLNTLQGIRDRFPGALARVAKYIYTGPEITDRMLSIRALPLMERRSIYLAERIGDQIGWYASRAKQNSTDESRWFWFVISAEIAAVVAAGIRIAIVKDFNPTGGVAAIAACLMAWLQTKRFSDLANTYSVAAADLKMIKERYGTAQTEAELQKLVDESESAISREHHLWVERRRNAG